MAKLLSSKDAFNIHSGPSEKDIKEVNHEKPVHKLLQYLDSPFGKLIVIGLLFSLKHLSKLLRDKPDWFKQFLTTKLSGWFVENFCVIGINYLRDMIPKPQTLNSEEVSNDPSYTLFRKLKIVLKNILVCFAGCISSEVGTVFVLHLLNQYVYNHVPYFTQQRKSDDPFTKHGLSDWLDGNAYLQIAGGGVLLGLIESFVPQKYVDDINSAEFSLLGFLRNFVVFRFVTDIVFYSAHRIMHRSKEFYRLIHKRHHEHYTTNLTTNFHFSSPDLFLESALPMFCGMLTLRSLGIRLSRWELHLLMGYTAWYELGTHLGKPLPIISAYPPLSFLYNRIFNIDKRAVEFHETHHNRRDCNFGITTWMDKLLGTEEFQFRGNAV